MNKLTEVSIKNGYRATCNPYRKLVHPLFLTLLVLLLTSSVQAKYNGGTGEPNNPYQIADANDLLVLAGTTADYGKCFILTVDVNMQGQVFTKAIIAPDTSKYSHGFQGTVFTGTFDGNGHKITNFTINGGSRNYYLGLFGYIDFGGFVKNLGLENCSVSSVSGPSFYSMYIGGLVGYSSGDISNCYSTGTVSGSSNSFEIGGLVGYNTGSISNCHSAGTVSGSENNVGGLVGYNIGSISDCHSAGQVSSSENNVGGLVGYNSGNIINCYSTRQVDGSSGSDDVGGLVGYNIGGISNSYSTGPVCGSSNIGGLAGYNDTSGISNCYSTGAVSGSSKVGGLVGWNYHGSIINSHSTGTVSGSTGPYWIGGLVGGNGGGSITSCYSTSSVNADYHGVGGLAGYNYGSISDCYSTGIVTGSGSWYVGGLVGWNDDSISNCYSTGLVSGENIVGGLIGLDDDGSVSGSFWDKETSEKSVGVGLGSSSGINGKTTDEMKMLSTFTSTEWDFVGEDDNGFDDFWRMCVDGIGYPKLSWEFTKGDFVCPDGVDLYDLMVFTDQWLLEKLKYNLWREDRVDIVNFFDWSVFANNWQGDMGQLSDFTDEWLKESAYCADIAPEPDGDGLVNMLDFAILANNWLAGVE